MEREEAIKALKWFKEYDGGDYDGGDRIIDKYGDCYYLVTERDFEAFDMAIKALEQEPIIDKIRAEIEQNAYPIVHGVNNHENGMTLYGILQIIDKYKAESEDNA